MYYTAALEYFLPQTQELYWDMIISHKMDHADDPFTLLHCNYARRKMLLLAKYTDDENTCRICFAGKAACMIKIHLSLKSQT